jgi:hypothetical protein
VKTKTIGTLLIAGLVLFSAMVVFAGTAAAQEEEVDPIKFIGYVTDANDDAYGSNVEFKKDHGGDWLSVGTSTIDSTTGYYETEYKILWPRIYGIRLDNYQMWVDGVMVDERYIGSQFFGAEYYWENDWYWWKVHHDWDYQIPEFATIAIPAIAVLGLFLFFNKRKQRK